MTLPQRVSSFAVAAKAWTRGVVKNVTMSTSWAEVTENTITVRARSLDTLKTFTLEIDVAETVSVLKRYLAVVANLAPECQKLILDRTVMEDMKAVRAYNVYDNCLVHFSDLRHSYMPVATQTGDIVLVQVVPSLHARVVKERIVAAAMFQRRRRRVSSRCTSAGHDSVTDAFGSRPVSKVLSGGPEESQRDWITWPDRQVTNETFKSEDVQESLVRLVQVWPERGCDDEERIDCCRFGVIRSAPCSDLSPGSFSLTVCRT